VLQVCQRRQRAYAGHFAVHLTNPLLCRCYAGIKSSSLCCLVEICVHHLRVDVYGNMMLH
jgi:hypothetical protein